jgi:nucleotide-binding universal stress UspA family protein
MFGKVLLAVDRSPQAELATEAAAKLAAESGDEVIVLHVIEEFLAPTGPLRHESMQSAVKLVEETARRLRMEGIKARPEVTGVLEGYVAKVIAEWAGTFKAGLIVMGSRGRTDLGALLLGSVAHKVLHLAACPVLIAR